MSLPVAHHLKPSERFILGECIGAGSFGTVYSAYDRGLDAHVALKELRIVDGAKLLRFKEEFRSLADVAHENLVSLFELYSDESRWWFTMELVDGVNLREYVRTVDRVATSRPTIDTDMHRPPADSLPAVGSFDEARLRAALRQLVVGVHALHLGGKLHCDLKPSNVLVTRDDRLKILDFGLVVPLAGDGLRRRRSGTPAYMSPEQAAGAPLTQASDWYAVGVVLFELLTGTPPIGGGIRELMDRKQLVDAPDARELAPDAPGDLAVLCRDLLQRSPTERPTGAELLERLGVVPPPPSAVQSEGPFVGRAAEQGLLMEALAYARGGRAVVLHVYGVSGIGKTALVRRFLDGLEGDALVFEGRCCERDTVPYKAIDPLIDVLARYLAALPVDECESLLPADIALLGRLFPALQRCAPIARAPPPLVADPHEVRRQAIEALRHLLRQLGSRHVIALWLDDLQWGDADSASMLVELFGSPNAPPVLLIASYRSEDAKQSALVPALRALERCDSRCEVREVIVGPLAPGESRELVIRILGSSAADRADAAARAAGGSPFFLHEITRFARTRAVLDDLSLETVLHDRIAELPTAAGRLLEALAVIGQSIDHSTLGRAAEVPAEDAVALGLLRSRRLVRTRRMGVRDEVELYHDRVREAVLARLSDGRLPIVSGRVGLALEATGRGEPEALATLFRVGGDLVRARRYTVIAAERAVEQLAFARAAELFRVARDLATAAERPALDARLGDALANAGRGPEAARAYLAAIDGAGAGEEARLRRCATEQLLRSGHVDEGLGEAQRVLNKAGLRARRGPARALVSLLRLRAQLRLRGIRFVERPESSVPRRQLERIDLCWSMGNGLGGIDLVRGAEFQARHLLLALRAGEPYRIARAIAWEAVLAAMEGGPSGQRRARQLVAQSSELSARIRHPHAIAWSEAARAIAIFCEGRFAEAARYFDRVITLFREAGRDSAWEVGSMQVWWLLQALYRIGDLNELARRAPICLKEAEEVGDRYTATSLRASIMPLLSLMADRPSEARRESLEAIERWSQEGWHIQHWCDAYTQAQVSIYEGDGARARTRLLACMPQMRRSFLVRVRGAHIQLCDIRARCTLAAGRSEPFLRAVERDAARLEKEQVPGPPALALLLRAGVAAARGQDQRAVAMLVGAERALLSADVALLAVAARRQRGRVIGGDEGRALMTSADAWLAGQAVCDTERLVAMLVPGFPHDDERRTR